MLQSQEKQRWEHWGGSVFQTRSLGWRREEQVLCGPGVSGEFRVNVDLIQGSALVPLLLSLW